jgi:hypothetical protein
MAGLDTPRWRSYIAGPVVGLVLLGFAGGANAGSYKGVQLPDGATAVGVNRFRASEDYDGTLRYYRQVYPPGTYRWKAIVDQPGVKAEHIELERIKGVEGLNIYEANGEVRIFVVPAPEPPPKKKTSHHPSRRSRSR